MVFFETLFTSLFSIITLFIATRLIGHRSMSQPSLFDYITGITIGAIASDMATKKFSDLTKPFVAIVMYALVSALSAILANKSIKVRRFLTGKPSILYDHGMLYYKNLVKAKIDINEFLMQCRVSGYFDLANIETAILEANGQISFLPAAEHRPVTGRDLKLKPSQDYLVANIVVDGTILKKNLEHTGHNETWLHNQLKAQGFSKVEDILLATCDSNNTVHIYKKVNEAMKKDLLE